MKIEEHDSLAYLGVKICFESLPNIKSNVNSEFQLSLVVTSPHLLDVVRLFLYEVTESSKFNRHLTTTGQGKTLRSWNCNARPLHLLPVTICHWLASQF